MEINMVWPEWHEDCVLGEGSFGKVYRAKRVEYGRTFYSAIKVLSVPKSQQEIKLARSQGMNDNEIYDYFRSLVDNLLNEITLMDNLKGAKNIVGIEDYKIIERQGEIGWEIFIRMELLTPFDSFISNPDFSQADVIKLGVDICSALEVCEQNCIVHRDIKPDNIFISRFGEYKLGDFGIARKLESTQANLSRKGTLNYMAPEIYKSEEYGSNVDIYSLGLVLYTLLNNNRMPFLPSYPQPITYRDNENALSKRLSGEAIPLPCNSTASLGAVITKACAYSPYERFASAAEFKSALLNEWNMITSLGNNAAIGIENMVHDFDINQKFQSTTNDMTANGRLVVEGYSQDTTVLNGMNSTAMSSNFNGVVNQNIAPSVADSPIVSSSSKSSKICRILAKPLAVAEIAFGIMLLISEGATKPVQNAAVSIFLCGLTILFADFNKKAVGVCVAALSFSYILKGSFVAFSGLQEEFPLESIIVLISGLLLLSAGIVFIVQKEARFGGSLCIYSIIIEWLFNFSVYVFSNVNEIASFWHIFVSFAALTVFIWSYGYNSNEKNEGIKRLVGIVMYLPALSSFVYALYIAYIYTSETFG